VSTVAEHLGSELIFPCPAAVAFPLATDIANFTGADEQRQLSQNLAQNRQIALPVVWGSEGASYGMIDESGTRRSDISHNIERGANNQGGNPRVFDHVRDETDGLMAKWSIGHEQSQINRSLLKFLCNGRCQIIFDFFVTTKSAHEGSVDRGNASNRIIPGKLC
jgi:hypothetical protein